MQFFKRTRNRATETSTATIPKMRISHTFVSVHYLLLPGLNTNSAIDLCKGNQFCFWATKGKGHLFGFIVSLSFCFMAFYPTWNLSKGSMESKFKMLGYWTVLLSAQQSVGNNIVTWMLCLILSLGSFYVQSLIIRGGKGSEGQGWGSRWHILSQATEPKNL